MSIRPAHRPVRRPAHRAERASRAHRTRATLLASTAVALAGGLVTGLGSPASAAMPVGLPTAVPASAVYHASATSPAAAAVMRVAARYVGTPYVYGGTTPAGFDCSGYTSFVFRQVGISLPRTANQQMLATRAVSAAAARPGDLVFYTSGGRAYHAAIYAGNGWMYDAPHTGSTVGLHPMWAGSVVYHRVLG